MSLLEIGGIVKRFMGVVALDSVDMKIDPAVPTGIIGPNGSGKTTLFNVVTGFLKPEKGTVTWNGETITGKAPHDIARRGLVRTFQQNMLFPKLSVYENVEIGAIAAGVERHERKAIVTRSLELLKISEYADLNAGSLPFGIGRRLGIACTLPCRPGLLLLDEPGAGLNTQETEDLTTALLAIRSEGYGICLIDHNMEFVMPFCNRIVVMNRGSVLAEGDPESITHNADVRLVYLGHST